MRILTIYFNRSTQDQDKSNIVHFYEKGMSIDSIFEAFQSYLDNGTPRGMLNVSRTNDEGKKYDEISINFENVSYMTVRE